MFRRYIHQPPRPARQPSHAPREIHTTAGGFVMPPITPQSSRTSLITGTVVSVIAAVTAIIFAIYFYVDANRTRDESATLTKKYHDVVVEQALASSDITDLKNRAGAEDATALGFNSGMTAMDI